MSDPSATTTEGGTACPKWVGDVWHQTRCGKPVKDEGLCARHLAGARRSRESRANHDDLNRRAKDTAAALTARLGVRIIAVPAYLVGDFQYVLDGRDIDALLAAPVPVAASEVSS